MALYAWYEKIPSSGWSKSGDQISAHNAPLFWMPRGAENADPRGAGAVLIHYR